VDVRIVALAPAPAIERVVPASVVAGTAGPLQVSVKGVGFTDRSRIYWNGVDRPTIYIDATELRTTLLTTELDEVTSAVVSVRTSEPGGGHSGTLPFDVLEAPANAPAIGALAPAQITAGWNLGFTLTITGTSFTPRTRVLWDGVVRESQYVNSTTLRTQVTPFDVRSAREVLIEVETPAPGGGRASARFPVRAIPVDRVDIQSPAGPAWTWVNNALPLLAVPRSVTGVELTDRQASWTLSDPTVATIAPTGGLSVSVYGSRRGAASIEATVDGVSTQRTITVYDAPPFDVVYTAGVGQEQYIGLWSPSLGQAPRRLPIDLVAFEPSPSSTGTHIVFSGMPRGGPVFGANVDLYVVSREGGGLQRLTTDEATDYQPAWSPDGTRIAFTSLRGGNRNVWVMNSDGTNLRRLTDAQPGAPNAGSGGSAGDAAWSPDGSQLAYGVTVGAKTSLWVMDADGSNKRPLTETMDGSAYDPAWSANGQLIAFRREFGSPTQIALTFVTAADGTTAFPVLSIAPMSATPAFSPDGQWLMASNSPLGSVATLHAVSLTRAGGPRLVLPATLGGARGARWMRRP
jgi:Tol biopolymer transport system component